MGNPLNTSPTASYAAYVIEQHCSAQSILDAIEAYRQRYGIEPDQIVVHKLTVVPEKLSLEVRVTEAESLRHCVYVGKEGWDPHATPTPIVEATPAPVPKAPKTRAANTPIVEATPTPVQKAPKTRAANTPTVEATPAPVPKASKPRAATLPGIKRAADTTAAEPAPPVVRPAPPTTPALPPIRRVVDDIFD